ncbi:hypothetical protein C8R45DRAFT_1082524 [Mycena sanguinolenta]|nr:hypothetical protein C8R45DRAFT_1082524 [Mycena sanguinolenta]
MQDRTAFGRYCCAVLGGGVNTRDTCGGNVSREYFGEKRRKGRNGDKPCGVELFAVWCTVGQSIPSVNSVQVVVEVIGRWRRQGVVVVLMKERCSAQINTHTDVFPESMRGAPRNWSAVAAILNMCDGGAFFPLRQTHFSAEDLGHSEPLNSSKQRLSQHGTSYYTALGDDPCWIVARFKGKPTRRKEGKMLASVSSSSRRRGKSPSGNGRDEIASKSEDGGEDDDESEGNEQRCSESVDEGESECESTSDADELWAVVKCLY